VVLYHPKLKTYFTTTFNRYFIRYINCQQTNVT